MNTNIDQWEVLEAVVQLGSFAAAANKLNRSQSTISYAISRLQEHFKIPLLKMTGRKAELTEAGKALLAEAEPLLAGFRALEQRAESLAHGGQTEIRISVDSLFPNPQLFKAIAKLAEAFPHLHPKLHKGAFLNSVEEFTVFSADLCICGLTSNEQLIKPILDVRLRAVARSDHPLNQLNRELKPVDLIQRTAVIIESIGSQPRRQPHSASQRYFAVNTIESAIAAVRSGVGFGWLPVYRIQSFLDSGELVGLRLPLGGERNTRMNLIMREFDASSREKNYLADLLGANGPLRVL